MTGSVLLDALNETLLAIAGGKSMSQVIIDSEIKRGFEIVHVGSVAWLPLADWSPNCVVSLDGKEVRLVLIEALRPGTGAFTALLEAIRNLGLHPVVLEPTRELANALKRRGWKMRMAGSDFLTREVQWRPSQRGVRT